MHKLGKTFLTLDVSMGILSDMLYSPSSERMLFRSDEGLSLEMSVIIHTFGSSPPFRSWLVVYTAYAAPQLFGLLIKVSCFVIFLLIVLCWR